MDDGCPNCGSLLLRRYCPDCGQRAPEPDDYSARAHAADAVDLLANLDGKIARTVSTLVGRPGALTADHLAGRRARYIRPLQLFLIVNVLLFIVAPEMPLFSYSLEKYWDNAPPSAQLVRSLVRREAPGANVSSAGANGQQGDGVFVPEEYAEAFNTRVETHRKSLIILFVPALALILGLLFARRAPAPDIPRRYGEHLVFALHVLAYVWLALAASYGTVKLTNHIPWEIVRYGIVGFGVAMALSAPAYVLFAVRRVYRLTWARATAATVALLAAFVALLLVYRGLLFFTTYYSL